MWLSIPAWLALVVYATEPGAEPGAEHTKEDRLSSTVTRQTTAGAVRGIVTSTGFQVYHGIRFAQAPVGPLRWKPSLPAKAWDGVFDATKPSPKCPQIDPWNRSIVVGQEDCLGLSVYVPPQCTPTTPCPVMQWIHGGAWSTGTNEAQDGTQLASHGVVVVAANYRLDALGWLALIEQGDGDSADIGNYGLYDQNLALKWTVANIREYGGDPLQVTLFGESTGGFSVCQHLIMEMSNHLFNKAIISSGSCEGPFAIGVHHDNRQFGSLFAKMIGCPKDPNGNYTARMECLRAKSVDEIIVPISKWNCTKDEPNTVPWCYDYDNGVTRIVPPLAPIVGFYASSLTRSLRGEPIGYLGRCNTGPNDETIAVMMGSNQDEMAYFIRFLPYMVPYYRADSILPVSNASFTKIVEHFGARYKYWSDDYAQKLEEQYPSSKYAQPAQRLNQFGTDLLFHCPTNRAARKLGSNSHDIYVYRFNFHFDKWKDPNNKTCQDTNEARCGVYHSSDVHFIFNQSLSNQADLKVAEMMGSYWTNFARFGTPNGPGVPKIWPLYGNGTVLEFTPTGSAEVSYEDPSTCSTLDQLAAGD